VPLYVEATKRPHVGVTVRPKPGGGMGRTFMSVPGIVKYGMSAVSDEAIPGRESGRIDAGTGHAGNTRMPELPVIHDGDVRRRSGAGNRLGIGAADVVSGFVERLEASVDCQVASPTDVGDIRRRGTDAGEGQAAIVSSSGPHEVLNVCSARRGGHIQDARANAGEVIAGQVPTPNVRIGIKIEERSERGNRIVRHLEELDLIECRVRRDHVVYHFHMNI
jgi:hypothetical protein